MGWDLPDNDDNRPRFRFPRPPRLPSRHGHGHDNTCRHEQSGKAAPSDEKQQDGDHHRRAAHGPGEQRPGVLVRGGPLNRLEDIIDNRG